MEATSPPFHNILLLVARHPRNKKETKPECYDDLVYTFRKIYMLAMI